MVDEVKIWPISADDPQDDWKNESDAWDGDISTFAQHKQVPRDTWTGYIIFNFPPTFSEKLRTMIWFQAMGSDVQMDVSVDGEWETAIDAHFSKGSTSGPVSFPLGLVTQVRARMRPDLSFYWGGGFAEIYLVAACIGPLAPICLIFHDIGDWFGNLADDIDDIMFVGDALAAPFRWAGERFHDLGDTCCGVSGDLQEILDALQQGVTWAAIEALLQEHAPELYGIMTDPVGWFLVKLTLAFDLEPYHTQSLEFLAKWVLEEYFPTLYLIWRDPDAWVEEHIAPLIPTLPDWLTDPDGWLRDAVERLFPTLTEFLADPDAWLRERVLDIIREFTEDIAAFLDNAWGWLLDQYEAVFETIHARLYYLAEHTLRFFWEGKW